METLHNLITNIRENPKSRRNIIIFCALTIIILILLIIASLFIMPLPSSAPIYDDGAGEEVKEDTIVFEGRDMLDDSVTNYISAIVLSHITDALINHSSLNTHSSKFYNGVISNIDSIIDESSIYASNYEFTLSVKNINYRIIFHETYNTETSSTFVTTILLGDFGNFIYTTNPKTEEIIEWSNLYVKDVSVTYLDPFFID